MATPTSSRVARAIVVVTMLYVLGISFHKSRKHCLEVEWYGCFLCCLWEGYQSDADRTRVLIHVTLYDVARICGLDVVWHLFGCHKIDDLRDYLVLPND